MHYIFGRSSPAIHNFSNIALSLLYVYMSYAIIRNVAKTSINLKREASLTFLQELRNSIRRKRVMIGIFAVLMSIFYIYQAGHYGVQPFLHVFNSDRFRIIFEGIHDLVTCFVLLILALIFHPYFFNVSFLQSITDAERAEQVVDFLDIALNMKTIAKKPKKPQTNKILVLMPTNVENTSESGNAINNSL